MNTTWSTIKEEVAAALSQMELLSEDKSILIIGHLNIHGNADFNELKESTFLDTSELMHSLDALQNSGFIFVKRSKDRETYHVNQPQLFRLQYLSSKLQFPAVQLV